MRPISNKPRRAGIDTKYTLLGINKYAVKRAQAGNGERTRSTGSKVGEVGRLRGQGVRAITIARMNVG